MKVTDEQLDKLQKSIMNLNGMNKRHESFVMVDHEEPTGDDKYPEQLFIKFMSDSGKTDVYNGLNLMMLCTLNNIQFSCACECEIDASQLRKLFISGDANIKKFMRKFGRVAATYIVPDFRMSSPDRK